MSQIEAVLARIFLKALSRRDKFGMIVLDRKRFIITLKALDIQLEVAVPVAV